MRLHHIAYVTKDVEAKAASFRRLLGFTEVGGPPIVDDYQGVKIKFMTMGQDPGVLLELLEPTGPASPVFSQLAKGGGLFHLCFEVDDLEAALDAVRKAGEAIVVRPPAQAPAIQNRRVAFVVTKERDLIEFVERGPG